jgi:hypothetical protein
MDEKKPTINQLIYTGRINEEVRYMTYYPCYVRDISSDKTRLIIEFHSYNHTYSWEVPASSVLRTIN